MNDKYVSIGNRIAKERKKLGYTQQQIADLCEVSRVQWGRYERDESELGGRVLKAFTELGASASYIATGERSTSRLVGKVSIKESEYTDEERKLVSLFRTMTIEQKKAITTMMESFVSEPKPIEKKSKTVTNIAPDNKDNKGYINQGNHEGDLSFGK